MVKTNKPKKEVHNATVASKTRKLFKKSSEKKQLKKLKGSVEQEKMKINSELLQKSISDKLPRKSKTEKIKVSEYLSPEVCKNFNLSTADIKNVIKALMKYRAENPKLQNQLFQEAAPLLLQISSHKIAKGISRIFRIPLKHSLYSSDDEICLIVSDVKGIRNIDHEKHIEHYENLLKNKGVDNIKKIMTFHEFRTEYETFEQKHRLVDLYSVFLADSKIAGKLVKKCGKIFYKKRKVPTAVKLQASKLKEHLDKALRKAFLNLHLQGNCYNVQFGHTNMTKKQLIQNFSSVVEFICKEFPGGFENIQNLLIATPRAPSIPVYVSTSKHTS